MGRKLFKAFIIPPALSGMRVPGQVPTSTRAEAAQVERALAKPKPLTEADLQRDTSPRLTAHSVVAGLGFDMGRMQNYRKFLDEQAASAPNETRYRQAVLQKMMDDKLDPDARRVLADRAVSYYRHRKSLMGKSILSLDDLAKAQGGPFIGPRGGKYADAEHTVAWKDKAEYHAQEVQNIKRRLKEKHGGVFDQYLGLGAKFSNYLRRELETHRVAHAAAMSGRAPTKEEVEEAHAALLKKAEPRGGTYYRRVTTEKGDHRYYYDPDKYHRRDDAHISGSDVLKKRETEKIPGGLAAGKEPEDFDAEALAAGTKVEAEHTDDKKVAREIAMDHLTEDPAYYRKLKTIEGEKSMAQDEDEIEKGDLTPEKARQILHDGTVHGKPITEQQRKYFGAVASGSAQTEKCMKKGRSADVEGTIKRQILHPPKEHTGVAKSLDPIADLSALGEELHKAQSVCEVVIGETVRHSEEAPERQKRLKTAFEEAIKANGGPDPDADGDVREDDDDDDDGDYGKSLTKSLDGWLEKASEGEGSRGGHVIGHTSSGKAIYARTEHHNPHADWTPKDHHEAAVAHMNEGNRVIEEGPWNRPQMAYHQAMAHGHAETARAGGHDPASESKPAAKTSGKKGPYEVHAASSERYRAPGGGTGTKWIIHDPQKPGGKEYHTYDTTGATPSERRAKALAQHASKHGIEGKIKHTDFSKRAAKQARMEAVQKPVGEGKVRVATGAGAKEMTAHHTAGNFTVHDSPGKEGTYGVTHAPSGLAVSNGVSKEEAVKMANHMHEKAGDALSDLKFGQKPAKKHAEGMGKLTEAWRSFKKSLEDNMDLDKWLSKAEISDTLPTDEPGFSEGVEVSKKKDGAKVAGVGKNAGGEADGGEGRVGSSRPGPSAAYPNTGVSTGETDKLSEDDDQPNEQMHGHTKALERTHKSFYESRYIPEAKNELEAQYHDAKRISALRKSEDVSVYIPPTRAEQDQQLQKSEAEAGTMFSVGRGDHQGVAVTYTDHLDRYIDANIQGPDADKFYPHGRPSIGALGNLQKSEECPACGLRKSLVLSSCPNCGAGTAVQNAGVIGGGVLVKSERVGPVLRRTTRSEAVVMPGGIIVVEE